MSSKIENNRPRQIIEPENIQNIILKYVRSNIKSMHPEKIISSILDKQAKIFVPFTVECEYQSDIRNKDKDKPLLVATIYHATQVKNHNKT